MGIPSDKVKDVIEDGANAADDAILNVAAKASEATHKTKVFIEDSIDGGRDALENALACSKDVVRANPLTAVAVVAAIAYLWGRLRN